MIGNAAYPGDWALSNPANDADAICQALKKSLRFPAENVACLKNLDKHAMSQAAQEFAGRLKDGDTALFYFSGHGFKDRDETDADTNFLVGKFDPRAPIESFGALREESLSAAFVVRLMYGANPGGANLMILDACRQIPRQTLARFQRKAGPGGQGFTGMNAPAGFVIAYATALGEAAYGGAEMTHSVYTGKLLEVLADAAYLRQNVLQVFNQTGLRVQRYTRDLIDRQRERGLKPQVPWTSTSPVDFCFLPPCADDSAFWQTQVQGQEQAIADKDAQIARLQAQLREQRRQVPASEEPSPPVTAPSSTIQHPDVRPVKPPSVRAPLVEPPPLSNRQQTRNTTTAGKRIGFQGRYIDNGDGTVTDTVTKLQWMRCAVGQEWNGSGCKGEAKKMNWKAAKREKAQFAGHDDWRLPAIGELYTLRYCSNGKPDYFDTTGCNWELNKAPTIDPDAFPETPAVGFWSSSLGDSGTGHTWIMQFGFMQKNFGYQGDYYAEGEHYATRLVRGGQ